MAVGARMVLAMAAARPPVRRRNSTLACRAAEAMVGDADRAPFEACSGEVRQMHPRALGDHAETELLVEIAVVGEALPVDGEQVAALRRRDCCAGMRS